MITKLAILFGALAILLPFTIGMVADRYGPNDPSRDVPRVSERFLERSPDYDFGKLKAWIGLYPEAAKGYAFPVLFPLDLLFMVSVAGFCAFASAALAGAFPVFPGRVLLICVVPALYLASDLIEDAILFLFLLWPEWIVPGLVTAIKLVWKAKIATFGLSIFQALGWAVVAMIWGH
jgi:hypothetical protein